ncbi:hypothetical protein [Vibrio cholerae]|uniref:hypothetical protein n=1 Tax=Vibrio cholerae TaxID=666 RepID=UPI001E358F80|nr:hypothetical protein [Vibrio cholerae]MCD1227673.1 hypothetical protein [Vibrio cholerae]HDZ9145577.1 hypothetical protein [Vibrio cholerae]HDZ9627115.1 hypothetical protein [Vibrio cholerae]
MQVIESKVPEIKNILANAAQKRSTVSYQTIYRVFDDLFDKQTATSHAAIWNTFECACNEIVSSEIAIYGALLSKKNTGLPDVGFFDVFRTIRREEYDLITENNRILANRLSEAQMRDIVNVERQRVYAHADICL